MEFLDGKSQRSSGQARRKASSQSFRNIQDKMKGILLESASSDYALVDNIEKPKPGKNQILVKSLVTGLNPVYVSPSFLVPDWFKLMHITVKTSRKAQDS
jgi:hypothetical protein